LPSPSPASLLLPGSLGVVVLLPSSTQSEFATHCRIVATSSAATATVGAKAKAKAEAGAIWRRHQVQVSMSWLHLCSIFFVIATSFQTPKPPCPFAIHSCDTECCQLATERPQEMNTC